MRIGIISDIHANDVALETVLQAIGPVDHLWCLGDVVGYGPNPNETVTRLQQQPALEICLTGNHDVAALGKIDLADFNPEARQAALWTREQLSAETERWLSERPEKVVRDAEFTLAHGSPRQPVWEYITSTSVARANFGLFSTPVCFVGHTHVPAIYYTDGVGIVRLQSPSDHETLNLRDGRRFIINPGSVGQPRDNDPRAAYAVLDADQGLLTFHRIPYDIELTQQRMADVGLPARLILRLNYGW